MRPRGAAFSLPLVALASTTCACATPVLHPLRAAPGVNVSVATTLMASAGTAGGCDSDTFPPRDLRKPRPEYCSDGQAPGWNLLQLSVGWSEVWRDRFGAMFGAYFPAFENLKDPHAYAAAALWSFFTVQNEYASAGVGPEIGAGGWSVTIGGELQPGGAALWIPRLGGYGRWFFPFHPDHEQFDGRIATWEFGPRIRSGPAFFQYTIYMQREGVMYWPIPNNTAAFGQGQHMLTFGLAFDADTVHSL